MARQWNLAHSMIELTLTHYSMSGHLPSHPMCLAVIISSCSSVGRVPSSRRRPELEPRWLQSIFLGQTETPRREEWSVSSFSRYCRATSQCQHAKGHPSRTALAFRGDQRRVLEKLAPCRLIGVRGKTIRRGIHGSTSDHRGRGREGSARWFLFPTCTWEPLLLTRPV